MKVISELLRLVVENPEVVVGLVVWLATVLKLSAWGRANAEVLNLLVAAVEEVGSKEVKRAVRRTEGGMSEVARDLLQDAVAKAEERVKGEE